jgi:hypothetical protein
MTDWRLALICRYILTMTPDDRRLPSEVADRAAILAQKEAAEVRFERRMLVVGSTSLLVGILCVVIAAAVGVWERPPTAQAAEIKTSRIVQHTPRGWAWRVDLPPDDAADARVASFFARGLGR